MARSKWALAGTAMALLGGAAVYYISERSTVEPDFALEREEGAFAVRRYPDLLTATIALTGARENVLRRGFQRLAAYIFAKDRPGEQIAMTAPVVQDQGAKIAMTAPVFNERGDEPETWRVRFVMPDGYTPASLPTPPADIAIETVSARRVAVIRFSGSGGDAVLYRKEAELRRWMEREGLQPIGGFEYAFYNSPFIPPFLRRNEVIVPIAG